MFRSSRTVMCVAALVLTALSPAAAAVPQVTGHRASAAGHTTASRVSLSLSRKTVAYDGKAVIRGSVASGGRSVAASPVTIWRQKAGSTAWRKVASATTNRFGAYRVTLVHQRINEALQTRFNRFGGAAAARSPLARLKVRAPLLGVATSPSGTSAPYGESRTWTGHTAKVLGGGTVGLQSNSGSGWLSVGQGTIGTSGTFSVTRVLSTAGVARYRLSIPTSLRYAAGHSRALSISTADAPAQVTITTTTLPGATQGQPYAATLHATGAAGTLTWSRTAGSLPPGTSLSPDGHLTGAPTAAGTFDFTARVTDGATEDTQALEIVVAPDASPITVSTTALADGVQYVDYSGSLDATGGTGSYTWTRVSGTLPAGVQLDAYGDLYGTPTAAGTSSFTVKADDGTRSATKALQLRVKADPRPPLAITSGLSDGEVGIAYSAPLTTNDPDSAATWTLVSGSLPPGLTLQDYGQLEGTPTAAGTSSFTLKADDGFRTATHAFSVRIEAPGTDPLDVTTSYVPSGTPGSAYAFRFVSNAADTLTWSLFGGSLPPGLALTSAGLLHGTPTTAGSSTFTVAVTDGARHAYRSLDMMISASGDTSLALSPATLPQATTDVPYSQQLSAEGGTPPDTFSVVGGSLPDGLSLSTDGLIDGVPTHSGSSPVSILVQDVHGSQGLRDYTLVVVDSPTPLLPSTTLPAGQTGVGYAYRPRIAGGTPPYSWSVTAGALPAGLTLLGGSGLIHGTPTASGTSTPTITVHDSAGHSVSQPMSLAIGASTSATGPGVDATGRSWSPGDTTITRADLSEVDIEWRTAAEPAAVTQGLLLACHHDTALGPQLVARDLASGAQQWIAALPSDCAKIVTTATQAVVATGAGAVAVSLTGSHAVTWNTQVTDPGSAASDLLVSGSHLVVSDGTHLTEYRLSDGARLWQRNATNGSDAVSAMVADGTRVYVLDQAQHLVAHDLAASGAVVWSLTDTHDHALVALPSRGELLTRAIVAPNGRLEWRSAATGAVLRSWDSPVPLDGGLPAADDTRAYVTTSWFDDTGTPHQVAVYAVRHADASLAWSHPTPDVVRGGLGVAGSLVFAVESGLVREGGDTTVETLDPANGQLLRQQTLPGPTSQRPYAAGGRLILQTRSTLVTGVMEPEPSVDDEPRPAAFVGSPYTTTFQATGGTTPYAWSVATGSVPAGLNLSTDGVLSGTPTSAATVTFTTKVTDAIGLTSTRPVSLTVRANHLTSWTTLGRDASHNPAALDDNSVNQDTLATFAPRWSGTGLGDYSSTEAAFSTTRAYAVTGQYAATPGELVAWDLTASGLSHAPVWHLLPSPAGVTFTGGVTLVGGVVYAMTSDGRLAAVDANTGTISWTSDTVLDAGETSANPVGAPVVTGSRALVTTGNHLAVIDLGTHAITWNRLLPADAMSTDGTRGYFYQDCHVVAVDLATGTTAWDYLQSGDPGNCYASYYGFTQGNAPVVSGSTIFAGSYWYGVSSLDAATGSVNWHAGSLQTTTPTPAVTDAYVVVEDVDQTLVLIDRRNGGVVATYTNVAHGVTPPTVSGDLVLIGAADKRVHAVDLVTGTDVWSSGVIGSYGPRQRAMVSNGRIYVTDGADLLALGPS